MIIIMTLYVVERSACRRRSRARAIRCALFLPSVIPPFPSLFLLSLCYFQVSSLSLSFSLSLYTRCSTTRRSIDRSIARSLGLPHTPPVRARPHACSACSACMRRTPATAHTQVVSPSPRLAHTHVRTYVRDALTPRTVPLQICSEYVRGDESKCEQDSREM